MSNFIHHHSVLRLQAILINSLILNLRSYDQSSDQSFSANTFLRSGETIAFGQHGPHSFVDTILGNLGEPLRTADDDDADEFDEEFGQSENSSLSEHA